MSVLYDEDFCDNCTEEISGRGVLYNGSVICQRCFKDLKKQDHKAENIRRKREENDEDHRF